MYFFLLPTVSVSPSAEIVEGSSVTLTCSSDANPAANYTLYKEDGNLPKAFGQNFTVTKFRPEHSGHYYCEAQNKLGRHNSTLQQTIVPGNHLYLHTGYTQKGVIWQESHCLLSRLSLFMC
uniref:Ig-like domain-containing protein n=1 Tax=Astatotilapia calliptera TaxID=8154 RepID=A0A3P8PNU8_ASTCA